MAAMSRSIRRWWRLGSVSLLLSWLLLGGTILFFVGCCILPLLLNFFGGCGHCLGRGRRRKGGYALPPPCLFALGALGYFRNCPSPVVPHRFNDEALFAFRRWAKSVGLVLDTRFLRYMQLAPVCHNFVGFLA